MYEFNIGNLFNTALSVGCVAAIGCTMTLILIWNRIKWYTGFTLSKDNQYRLANKVCGRRRICWNIHQSSGNLTSGQDSECVLTVYHPLGRQSCNGFIKHVESKGGFRWLAGGFTVFCTPIWVQRPQSSLNIKAQSDMDCQARRQIAAEIKQRKIPAAKPFRRVLCLPETIHKNA